VLIRKKEPEHPASMEALAAAADLLRLVPDNTGFYASTANPSADSSFVLLETKLLTPHLGPTPVSHFAPEVQLTSGEQGASSDLETRIDLAQTSKSTAQTTPALKQLLEKTPLLASLKVQSSQLDAAGVFVRIHAAVVLAAASDWSEDEMDSAIIEFVRPGLTARALGVGWQQKPGYRQLDGLWPLSVSARGIFLVVSDDPKLIESVLANFSRRSDRKPLELAAGFNHDRERENFTRFTGLVDRPNATISNGSGIQREPQFFSGNVASLSATLAVVSAEKVEIRSEGSRVYQTVNYEWSQ
jgi:hypothetical protein